MRDTLPLYKRLVWLYAIALGGMGVSTLWAVSHWPSVGWLQTDGPNFGADLVGLALTLLLIDRLVAWRREADLFPRRQSAIRRLGSVARDLEVFLIWSYKAASPEKSPEPQSIDGLIDAWASAIEHLDLTAPAERYGQDTWMEFLTWKFDRIGAQLDDAVTRYDDTIPPRLAATIEAMLDQPAFRLLRNRAAFVNAMQGGFSSVVVLGVEALTGAVRDFYREYAAFRRRPYRLVTWPAATHVEWGSARS